MGDSPGRRSSYGVAAFGDGAVPSTRRASKDYGPEGALEGAVAMAQEKRLAPSSSSSSASGQSQGSFFFFDIIIL